VFLFLANEIRSWVLFYSTPCLKNILPDPYWEHYGLLVEGMHIILGKSISKHELKTAKDCFRKFYQEFENLYGEFYFCNIVFLNKIFSIAS